MQIVSTPRKRYIPRTEYEGLAGIGPGRQGHVRLETYTGDMGEKTRHYTIELAPAEALRVVGGLRALDVIKAIGAEDASRLFKLANQARLALAAAK